MTKLRISSKHSKHTQMIHEMENHKKQKQSEYSYSRNLLGEIKSWNTTAKATFFLRQTTGVQTEQSKLFVCLTL